MIPKILHQVWVGENEFPEEYRKYHQSFRSLNPSFKCLLWTEDNIIEFVSCNSIFEKLRCPAERADIIRLLALKKYGGFYFDVDFKPVNSLENLTKKITNQEFVVCDLKPGRVNNAFMASIPEGRFISHLVENIKPREYYGYDKNAAGPLYVNSELAKWGNKESILILAPRVMYGTEAESDSQTIAIHQCGRSWKEDSGWKQAALNAEKRLEKAQKEIAALTNQLHLIKSKKKSSSLLRRAAAKLNLKKRIRKNNLQLWSALMNKASFITGRSLHRNYLVKSFQSLSPQLRGAEIGVQKGLFSRFMLENLNFEKLYLVDPWLHDTTGIYNDTANVTQNVQESIFLQAKYNVSGHDAAHIIRDFSIHAVRIVPDNSLDFVYIDARHDYNGVMEDLVAWYPKVKRGGIIAGHDYLDGMHNGTEFGVVSAVNDFIKKMNIDTSVVNRTYEPWPSFFFVKP